MVLFGSTGAVVLSQLVAAWPSKPVPVSSVLPRLQLNILPPAEHGGPPEQPHTSTKALFTLTGLPSWSNEMLPSV